MIIGHSKIIEYLVTAWQTGTLANTYCLAGPAQVGKRAVARYCAAQILGVREEQLANNPDFFLVERQENEKTGKLKKELTVTQARELRARLSRRAWLGGYQIAIVDEAELLNEESANALLKILEEPPEKTVIFLLTDNEQVLLPTIRSRSSMICFNLVTDAELSESLEARGIASEEVSLLTDLAWGRPGRAILFHQHTDLRESYFLERERFQNMLGQPFYKKLSLVDSAFGDKEDAVRGREKLQEIMGWWIMWWRDMLLNTIAPSQRLGSSSVLPSPGLVTASVARIVEIIDIIESAQWQLGNNIHPRLAVERALLTF